MLDLLGRHFVYFSILFYLLPIIISFFHKIILDFSYFEMIFFNTLLSLVRDLSDSRDTIVNSIFSHLEALVTIFIFSLLNLWYCLLFNLIFNLVNEQFFLTILVPSFHRHDFMRLVDWLVYLISWFSYLCLILFLIKPNLNLHIIAT